MISLNVSGLLGISQSGNFLKVELTYISSAHNNEKISQKCSRSY